MSSDRVLVTDGLNGTTLDAVGAVRALRAGGLQPVVTVTEGSSWVALSRHAHSRVAVPPLTSDDYADAVRSAAEELDVSAIVPASEPALLALGVTVPELLDKRGLSEAALAAGLQAPEHLEFGFLEELHDAADDLPYPVVVKPAVRTYKAFRAEGPNDVRSHDLPGAVVVQPFITGPIECVGGVMWSGELHSASHERWVRMYPRDVGLAAASVTVEPDTAMEAGLATVMSDYEGIFCAQFVGGHLIDLNLRSYLTIELGMAAGVNVPATYARLARGENVPRSRARPGVRFRWVSGDLKALRERATDGDLGLADAIEVLRPRWGTVRPLMRLDDPMPFFGRLLDGYVKNRGGS